MNGRPEGAHRLAVVFDGREIPAGYEAHHTCSNRGCVNPAHLRVMTKADHTREDRRWSHCKRGHPLAGDNLAVIESGKWKGKRYCKECNRLKAAERRQRERGCPNRT